MIQVPQADVRLMHSSDQGPCCIHAMLCATLTENTQAHVCYICAGALLYCTRYQRPGCLVCQLWLSETRVRGASVARRQRNQIELIAC